MIGSAFVTKMKTALRLGRALRLVWESAPGWTAASTCLLVAQGVLPLVVIYITKLIVDTVTSGITSADKAGAFGHVALLIGLAGGAALVAAVCRTASYLVGEAQSQTVTDHVMDVMHAKSLEMDLGYYESPKYYDSLHRAQTEAPFRPTNIVRSLSSLLQNSVSLVGVLGLLFSLNWMIALLLFFAAIPGLFIRLKFSDKLYQWQRDVSSRERECWYYDWMISRDTHAKEVRLFDLGGLFRKRFNRLRTGIRQERIALTAKRSIAETTTEVGAVIAVFGSYAYIAHRAINGAITIGDLVMYMQVFQRGLGFLQSAMSGLADLYEGNLFLSYLTEFLDLRPRVTSPADPKPVQVPMRSGIALNNVGFTYPDTQKQILTGINLSIRPGQVVALVGENGSGKTTLIKLLCRLYDPTEGCITIDGTDIREMDITSLRREIGVIFQDYARYNLTAHDNIWFGNTDVSPDDRGKVRRAAQHSGADQVIEQLTNGYETVLGRWFEDGEELSIGQWQKIALARAFLRDAQIIVLDEPSSAMDPKAEYEFFSKFRDLLDKRSAVIISHRFSTVRMADSIYVLENGGIIEHGSHEELMALDGRYAGMFLRQAQQYLQS